MGTVGSNPTPSAVAATWDERHPRLLRQECWIRSLDDDPGWIHRSSTSIRQHTDGDILLLNTLPGFRKRSVPIRWIHIAQVVVFFVICAFQTAAAQVVPLYSVIYRPPGLSYDVLRGDHFDIIFERGLRKQASETLYVLESTLAGTDSLTGAGYNIHMPVVLNKYDDRANGFVTPFPFKQEIAATSRKGRGLSRRHPSWTFVVASHELVHAAQADFGSGAGLVGFVRLFSPDFARSLNMFVPPGISEGVAVLRESRLTNQAGRLNHSFFNMLIRAAFEDGRGWSLSQMLENPEYTRPYDRYYQGGAHFVEYLVERFGEDVIRRLSRWQFRIPILGFGANIHYATGESPGQLSRDFRNRFREQEAVRLAELGTVVRGRLVFGQKGAVVRRPLWTSESTIVAYSLGYNLRRGFYDYDAVTGKRSLIAHSTITEDAAISLTQDSTGIVYSRYERDPFVGVQERANVFRVNLESGKISRKSTWAHAINPVEIGAERILALRNAEQFTSIVEIDERGFSRQILDFERADFVSMHLRPRTDSLAILMNVRGHQALFISDVNRLQRDDLKPWIGFGDASIYDATWSRDGRYLIFTADLDGVLNIYAADEWTDRIFKLTNVPYGAMEGSLSPSNNTLAFVEYRDQRFELRTLPFNTRESQQIDRASAHYTSTIPWRTWLHESFDVYGHLEPKPYRPLKYLGPRMLYPTMYLDAPRRTEFDARMGFGVGLAIQGTDPLQKWTYYAEGVLQKRRLWGEFGIQWGGFILRPELRYSSRPLTVNAIIRSNAGDRQQRVLLGRKQASLGFRIPITLHENEYRSYVTTLASLHFREDRFYDDDFEALTSATNRITFSPALLMGIGVQQNGRDIVPNSGVGLRFFADVDISAEGRSLKRALIGLGDLHLPWMSKTNTGLVFSTGFVTQNNPSVFNLDFFKPRGREDIFLPDGTFLRYGFTVTQPILFIDDGFMMLPIYLKAAYLYGFVDHIRSTTADAKDYSSVGGGLGLQLRVFYTFNFTLKLEAAYLPERNGWDTAFWLNSTRY